MYDMEELEWAWMLIHAHSSYKSEYKVFEIWILSFQLALKVVQ